MQKMIFKKHANSDPEIVWLMGTCIYEGTLYGIIMRNYVQIPSIETNPYDKVKLTRLKPLTEDFNKCFYET